MSVSSDIDLIPREIDEHLARFGKEAWDVDYDRSGYVLCAFQGWMNVVTVLVAAGQQTRASKEKMEREYHSMLARICCRCHIATARLLCSYLAGEP